MPLQRPSQSRIPLPLGEIEALCRKWRIRELSLFGSVLREDFHSDSDVDVLVQFGPEAHWSLFDFVDLQDELQVLLQRKVDVVSERGLRNPFRRKEILGTRQVVYAVDPALMWDLVRLHLPDLVQKLEGLIPSEERG